jgi:hypothetical protein
VLLEQPALPKALSKVQWIGQKAVSKQEKKVPTTHWQANRPQHLHREAQQHQIKHRPI